MSGQGQHFRARRRWWTRGTPASRLLSLCAVAVAVLATAAGALAAPQRTLQPAPPSRYLEPGSYWGGPYTASTGETVTVYVSRAYAEDPALGQRWADFLASLVHGSELSSLTVYLTSSSEVDSICGSQALACYGASANLMVAPADDPSANTSAEAVVTHEYGHHIAAHRSNAPWPAVDYGTKRWATYTHVCTDAESGKLYPGAEQLPRYQLNPGEAFAEAYRVLNERAAGLPELAWQIVDRSLYPDDTALALLRADVTTPWTGPTTVTRTGRVAKGKGAQTYTFTTPLDGPVQVTLQAPRGARLSFELVSSLGDRATRTGTGTLSFKATLCGDRSLTIRVKRISGAGPFRLSVARP